MLKLLFALMLSSMAPMQLISALPVDLDKGVVSSTAKPYSFGYDVVDEYGNRLYRAEVSDQSGSVRGSYGYTDMNGLARQVAYVADHDGFRASILSNEPGLRAHQPAAAFYSTHPNPEKASPSNQHPPEEYLPSSSMETMQLSKGSSN